MYMYTDVYHIVLVTTSDEPRKAVNSAAVSL